MTESKYLKREFGEALPTFKGVMKQHQINKLEEGWWDNMSDEAQAAYIKKYGEAPGSTGDDDKGDKARATAKSRDKALDKSIWGDDEDDYDMGEVPGSRGTGPWTPEDDPDFEHGPSLTSAPGRVPDEDEYPDKDPINTKKGEMEDEMEDIANELDNVTDPDEKKELEDRYDKIDQELYDINKKQYGDDSGYEKSGRTGKELDQETLTINGKQYNRISEGVEKQPKDLRDRSKKMKKHKLQENYERMFGSIKEDWWDDMSPENQAQYIKDHPNSKQAKDAGGDDEGGGDNSERLGQIAQERAAAEQEMADAEEMGDKAAYADAQEKIDDLDKEDQIDITIIVNGEPFTIEVRSSFPYARIEEVITKHFSILGWYTTTNKPYEKPKDFYLRVLFPFGKAKQSENLQNGFVLYFVGGATSELLNSSKGGWNNLKQPGASYRTIKPICKGYDVKQILDAIFR